ncbi:hypothetical protein MG293_009373 [Ovis ammon polii]|uniref:Uncharacterized protein n=1 Tax=Ovis ammon polii TaxID=230172 RepID=A0AAD4U5P0_OVIAM|nr:hypothetical protein MG293_009373 [Ovis ammon polii]KAI4568005.1 hypothetical protein MJT46_007803 [Ovis ammon polii x Ovis aries]
MKDYGLKKNPSTKAASYMKLWTIFVFFIAMNQKLRITNIDLLKSNILWHFILENTEKLRLCEDILFFVQVKVNNKGKLNNKESNSNVRYELLRMQKEIANILPTSTKANRCEKGPEVKGMLPYSTGPKADLIDFSTSDYTEDSS